MKHEMDKIAEERDGIQNEIDSKRQFDDQENLVIEQTDRWQKSTIEKVIEVAAHARQQALELLNTKRKKFDTEFQSFSQNLIEAREAGNYVEHHLKRLKRMVHQFQQDLNDSIAIAFHTEQSDKIIWENLIHVEDQRATAASKFILYSSRK